MLFYLPDLPHGLLENGTFVRLDVEAVDVGEVGGDELRQLFDVFALLLPPTLVTPAGEGKGGLDTLPWRPRLHARGERSESGGRSEPFRRRGSRTHPRPGVSQLDSLRLRSEHSGSNELSPTPLIFSTLSAPGTHTNHAA